MKNQDKKNIKNAIIMPSYKEHFGYVKNFLKSYSKNVKNKIPVYLILSNKEEIDLLKQELSCIKIKDVFYLDIITILQTYNIYPTKDLLNNIGKYSYQTLKKLYAIHYLNIEQTLILDSESLVCSKTDILELFENYFSNPYVLYSEMPKDEKYKTGLDYKTSVNCHKLLNLDFKPNWYLEGFHWFYDINIIKDLFAYFNNDLYTTIYNFSIDKKDNDKAVFECILYYLFIRKNNTKYNYNYININQELVNKFNQEELDYIYDTIKRRNIFFLPFTIHGIEFGKVKFIPKFADFYKKYKIQIGRLYPIRNKRKIYIIKEIIKQLNLKIICSTDNVGMYKKINSFHFDFFKLFLNKEDDCNQW